MYTVYYRRGRVSGREKKEGREKGKKEGRERKDMGRQYQSLIVSQRERQRDLGLVITTWYQSNRGKSDLRPRTKINGTTGDLIRNRIGCQSLREQHQTIMASSLSTKTLLYVQLVIFFTCSFCLIEIKGRGVGVGGGQREFDYFALALQWPGTFCQRTRHCCSSNACCRGSNAPTEFTIHGLWPDYNDGTWPACCTRSNFDIKKISTLLDALEKYWPSLSCGSSSTCHGGKGPFWAHEWEKHGTCSFPVVRDEYNYFLTVLNVYFKYNVTEVLNEAGYAPSNSEKYPLGGIVSAIQNAFRASPLLVCSNGAVEELRLCFYKDFKPRDCVNGSSILGDMNSSKSSCPSYVSLPTYVSLGIEDGGTAISRLPDNEAL